MLVVKKCENAKGNYFTIINKKNNTHCHSMNGKEVEKIKKCYYTMSKGGSLKGFSSAVRKKTMHLLFNCQIIG